MTDDIRPSSSAPDEAVLHGDFLTFRPRSDFRWGDSTFGDFVSQLGYRIYPAMFHDEWVVVDVNRKRLGTYTDLRRAVMRADGLILDRIGDGLSDRDFADLFQNKRCAPDPGQPIQYRA